MPNTQPTLPIARFDFRYRALERFDLEEDPRGLWHGVFGRALHELSCIVRRPDCSGCLLLHQCQYSYLFSGPRPPDADLMRRYDRIPVPHVFHLAPDFPRSFRVGDNLNVSLTLVGDANQRLPLVIQTMARAGQAGIGARRARLQLEDVRQSFPTDAGPDPIASDGRLHGTTSPRVPQTPPPPAVARLRFQSPYKASGKGNLRPDGFAVGPFLMALVRRVSLLQYFYTDQRLEAEFERLKTASEGAHVLDHGLRRQAASRYGARHRRRVDTSGLVGHLDLDMNGIEPLWPYLHLGQWLNVGKNASMGYGAYEIGQKTLGDGAQERSPTCASSDDAPG